MKASTIAFEIEGKLVELRVDEATEALFSRQFPRSKWPFTPRKRETLDLITSLVAAALKAGQRAGARSRKR